MSGDNPLVLIAGGSGIFGRLLAREILATTPAHLLVAGRDAQRAAAACRALRASGRAEPRALELRDPRQLARAAEGCFAVVCTAGPFQGLPLTLPRTTTDAGAHWLDISDFAGWVLPLLADASLETATARAGRAVLPGLSTTPALTGILTRWCREHLPPTRPGQFLKARLTLYIGNRNPKGPAMLGSVLTTSFTDPQPVEMPFGRRLAYRCSSPDATLLRQEWSLEAEFHVAFEMPPAARILGTASSLARGMRPTGRARLARWLSLLSAPLSRFGSDAGCLQVELADETGPRAVAALTGAGQRLAILPCALALEALLSGELTQRGVLHPAAWLSADEWIARLQARGLRFEGRIL